MRKYKRSLILAMVMILTMTAAPVYAASTTTDNGPPPPPPMGPPSGICGDETNVYVVADGKILQYDVKDMALVTSINLPKPPAPPEGAPPAGPPPEAASSGKMPPPPMGGGSHGAWVSDGMLYVLAGHTVYRYTIPDLTLQNTVKLPKPEPPTATTTSK